MLRPAWRTSPLSQRWSRLASTQRPYKVAVQGCCYGDLNSLYTAIGKLQAKGGYKVDLVLICGDVLAVRNWSDTFAVAVPSRERALGNFYQYYSGQKEIPIPTIVIGGALEASNYMSELFHGGWLAPNLYFLGNAGSVIVNGLRISGASGTFAPDNFKQGGHNSLSLHGVTYWSKVGAASSTGFHEKLPYTKETRMSSTHIREFSIQRLSLLPQPHIFLSYDWTAGIASFRSPPDSAELPSRVPLTENLQRHQALRGPGMHLLRQLKPDWWFSPMLRGQFEADAAHDKTPPINTNTAAGATAERPEMGEQSKTWGVGMGAFKPKKLQILDILPPQPGLDPTIPASLYPSHIPIYEQRERVPMTISYDPHWLAITRAFQPFFSATQLQYPPMPNMGEAMVMAEKELQWVMANVPRKLQVQSATIEDSHPTGQDEETWAIARCQTFAQTAPAKKGRKDVKKMPSGTKRPPWYTNPQTKVFCDMLEIEDKVNGYQTGP